MAREVRLDIRPSMLIRPGHRQTAVDSILLRVGLIDGFVPHRVRRPTAISWSLLPSGRLKLNVDAAFAPGWAGGGCVLRNATGDLVAALSFPLHGASSSLHVEALAMEEALSWCTDLSIPPFEIETDSLTLARLSVSIMKLDYLNMWNLISIVPNLAK